MYQQFIGIDISKEDFVVAIHSNKQTKKYTNNTSGFDAFYNDYKKQILNALVVLETTGGYEMNLITYLVELNISVHRANTRKVKNFIRSYGVLAKSDSIDAYGLALYGSERYLKLPLFQENPYQNLLKLVQRRNDLKAMLVQEKNRLQAPGQQEFKKSFENIIKTIEQEMKKMEGLIEEIFKANPQLETLRQTLKTIKGIGNIVAVYLIALMPELGRVNRKEIASLAGLAPHPYESGKKIGYRFTKGGRKDIKPILFLAAMTAARGKSELASFYNRLVKNGKKKMVALTALMRKILVIANARVRDHLNLVTNTQHG